MSKENNSQNNWRITLGKNVILEVNPFVVPESVEIVRCHNRPDVCTSGSDKLLEVSQE